MRHSRDEKLRILCTGATGPYGAHFAKLAIERGHDVFSIRHLSKPQDAASLLGIADKITWAQGDIRDSSFLSLCLANFDIQAVAHFAALPLVKTGTIVTEPIFGINVGGTVALLDAVAKVSQKDKKILFLQVGTDKEYGDAGDQPYTENMPLLGASIYEASKAAASVACRAYQKQKLVPNLVISRSCNIVATADLNWRLISNTVRQLLVGVPAKVYTRGQYVREFIHVDDAVSAQFDLMMRADEYAGQEFNIGSGQQFTQEEMISHIRNTHFPQGQIIRVEPPLHDTAEIAYQRLDCSKIKRILGWAPKKTVEEAVSDVVLWWREHQALAPWSLL